VVIAAGHAGSTPYGPAINVFNFSGGRSRIYRQHPSGGPPSMSPTSVVVTAGLAVSTPQEARHQRLQLRWWPLPDMQATPPRGAAIDVFNFGGGRCWTCRQHPPGGPPSTSLTSGPPAPAPPRGPLSTCFLALMMGASGHPAPAPPGGPSSTVK
jgi:hypothetical protein